MRFGISNSADFMLQKTVKLTLWILKANGQQKDFLTIHKAWQNTLLDNINVIAEFSSRTMRSSTTTFLANQNSVFKNSVKNRMRPLLPDDEAFENMFASMSLDIDCKNQENLPVVDNSLTSGINGVLIKVFIRYFFLEVFEQINTIGNFYIPTSIANSSTCYYLRLFKALGQLRKINSVCLNTHGIFFFNTFD